MDCFRELPVLPQTVDEHGLSLCSVVLDFLQQWFAVFSVVSLFWLSLLVCILLFGVNMDVLVLNFIY